MLRTAAEGYKVLQLKGQTWPALDVFYTLTLGNARALGLEHEIGTLEPGSAADLVVLDPCATPAMAHRMERIAGDLASDALPAHDHGRRARGPRHLRQGKRQPAAGAA